MKNRIAQHKANSAKERQNVVPNRTNEETTRRATLAREIQILGAKYNGLLLNGTTMEKFLSAVFRIYGIKFPNRNKSPAQFHKMMLTTAEIKLLLNAKSGLGADVKDPENPPDEHWEYLQDKIF